MTSKTFVDLHDPVVDAAWLNDVDGLRYGNGNAAKGSALLEYIPSGTGAVARTALSKFRDKVSVKDFGATGDGSTDDTAAIQNAINSFVILLNGTAQSGTVFFPRGRYQISSTLVVPPAVVLEGDGQFAMTNATTGQGSLIYVSHNGVGIRFLRVNSTPGNLWHMGGMTKLAMSGPGAGASVKLVELGDSGTVDTSHGAWGGFIRDCVFSFATTGYGIYAANSQSWEIENCTFRTVKYPIYYNTVAASCLINHNTIDNTGLASGSAGCGIFLRPGTLGGAAGVAITNNYVIGADYGIYLCSILGAQVTGNVVEGIYNEGFFLSKYLLDFATVDGSGCMGCNLEGNGIINWCADAAGANSAIQISYSPSNFIGKNLYQSPNGAAGPALGVYDATTLNNIIIAPIVTGTNAGTIPPLQYNNTVLANNTIIAADWYQFSNVGAPTTASWGAGEKGRLYMKSDVLRMWSKGPTGGDPQEAAIAVNASRTSTNEGATIDVTGCTTVVVRNVGAQTITAFTDNAVYVNKEVTFYADNDSNSTFGLALGTRGSVNYNLVQYSSITFQYINATIGWSEKCRKAA